MRLPYFAKEIPSPVFTLSPSPSPFHPSAVLIPWPIILSSLLGVILITWHVLTSGMDFMTPTNLPLPPEDFGADLATGAPVMQPKIKDGPKFNLPAQPTEDEVPIVAEVTDEELGDLESAPGLTEYRSYAQKASAQSLFALSSTLQARGDFQRALIALERIIDTCKGVTPEELKQASADIASLSPTLPQWNVDPMSETELVLHFKTTKKTSEVVKEAALEIATLIRKHSGDQLEITPRIETSNSPQNTSAPTITVWLSSPERTQGQTAFSPVPPAEQNLTPALIRSTFQSVRGHLVNLGYPFSDQPDQTDPKELLTRHITRLMWHDLAKALTAERPKEDSAD